ncbi:MAG: M48 family metallopeptidase [Candidatus Methanoplasma sp.]|nr:M48 family metallopeptidase [Candidatus Methanoplasma sp.]
MEAEEVLRTTFKEIGKEYGFDKVEAEFVAFKEFKVRWQRSYKWADFKVSDYLEDAPPEVIAGLCTSLFSKITGEDEGYSEDMCRWITAPTFSEYKQPLYLKRSRNLTRSHEGEKKDLEEAYKRLADMGLVEKDPSVHLTWTKESNIKKIGYCSVLMKVITISNVLDTDMIPDFVLDYCLYHELCHLIIGFDPSAKRHGEEFQKLEAKFPKRDEAEEWLKRLCLYL